MRVAEIMTSKVFIVTPNDMIDRAFFLIHYEKVRHLPVVDKGKVVGIVSDRDLYKALGPKSNSKSIENLENTSELHVIAKKVQNIMRRGVFTVGPNSLVSEAASIMADNKIGALPVEENGKLVGILSATDILRVFSKIEKAREKRDRKIAEGQH